MKAFALEHALRKNLLAIIAAALPVATFASACGGDGGSSDAGDACNTCFCTGQPPPPGPTYDVTYEVCPSFVDAAVVDAADDASDASGDASDDADATEDASPPTNCYYDCSTACAIQQIGGQGRCLSESGDGGTRVAHCQVQYLCGRKLEGLVDAASDSATLGATFARAAWLEAASIHAFRRIARELRVHGAPRELVDAARRCARDEARHARTMARIARAHGATIPRVRVDAVGVRDLEAIARENAVEGCVGETYGALLAMWQAERAHDPDVRAAMVDIAPDETRHAALAWAIAAWADLRLSEDARARVREAREQAVRTLADDATHEPEAHVAFMTGAPRAAIASQLVAKMRAEVWS
jgi:hypothetical protein